MNICSTNSTTSVPSHSIANAKFTQLSDFAERMGIKSEIVHSVIRSGGGGLVPAIDLVRDSTLAAESFYKYRTAPSTGPKLALIGRVTEVAYDISEITPSVGTYFHVLSPQSIETISYIALLARIAGQIVLLPSCIDETRTSFGGTSLLGTKTTHQDMTFRNKTVTVLTFLEAATSTVSNGALLLGGPDNSIHLTASVATNSIKALFLFLPHIFIITSVFEKILTPPRNVFMTPHPRKINPKDFTPQETAAINSIVKKCLNTNPNSVDSCDITLSIGISPNNRVSLNGVQVTPTNPTSSSKKSASSSQKPLSLSPIANAARRHFDRHTNNGSTPIKTTPSLEMPKTATKKLRFSPTPKKGASGAPSSSGARSTVAATSSSASPHPAARPLPTPEQVHS